MKWLAKDRNGDWYIYREKPTLGSVHWYNTQSRTASLNWEELESLFGFPLPVANPDVPWEESLIGIHLELKEETF